ncbi:hypothetical protein D3C71_18840 [compost metagenome]
MSAPSLPPIPPNTYFLSRDEDWHTAVWAHGTRAGALAEIARHGLRPRQHMDSLGNWVDNPSAAHMVYLTTAYALHYAAATEGAGLVTILQVDQRQLAQNCVFADEDSYAQSRVAGFEELEARSLEERVSFWRDRLDMTDPQVSLRVLGNVTYKGIIPAEAVTRVRLLAEKEARALTLRISDPVVSPENFKLLGGCNQRFVKWLLGHDTDLNDWFDRACRPSIPVMTLQEAVEYVQRERP